MEFIIIMLHNLINMARVVGNLLATGVGAAMKKKQQLLFNKDNH